VVLLVLFLLVNMFAARSFAKRLNRSFEFMCSTSMKCSFLSCLGTLRANNEHWSTRTRSFRFVFRNRFVLFFESVIAGSISRAQFFLMQALIAYYRHPQQEECYIMYSESVSSSMA